jgi:hypothetical protein
MIFQVYVEVLPVLYSYLVDYSFYRIARALDLRKFAL